MYKIETKRQIEETIVYEHQFPNICKEQIYIHCDYGSLNNYIKIKPIIEGNIVVSWFIWYYSYGKTFTKLHIKLTDIDFTLIEGELKHVSLKDKHVKINNILVQYLLDTNNGINYFYNISELDFAKEILKFINS